VDPGQPPGQHLPEVREMPYVGVVVVAAGVAGE
jgi:hypothetical protein